MDFQLERRLLTKMEQFFLFLRKQSDVSGSLVA